MPAGPPGCMPRFLQSSTAGMSPGSSDHLSPKARSAHMRRIRKTGTKPEMRVWRAAHRLGYRFRLHRKDLPGTLDLVFPRLKKVVHVSNPHPQRKMP